MVSRPMAARRHGFAVASLAAAGAALALAACQPPKPIPQSLAFACSPGAQTWTVPTGVTTATFAVYGAEGGTVTPGNAVGGRGGLTVGTVAVTPNETLGIVVGCAGGKPDQEVGGTGSGAGGGGGTGGARGGGGGGGSGVRRGTDPIFVAGGGGGASFNSDPGASDGGAGGGANQGGTDGGSGGCDAGAGGDGATLAGPGAGGTHGAGGDGDPGSGPAGGKGADFPGPPNGNQGGGGGGGGYFGGGGGASASARCGGGGGGSGFAHPSATGVAGQSGVQTGDGTVVVMYAV